MRIINTTPHPIVFVGKCGEEFTVSPCGILINAKPVEEDALERGTKGEIDPARKLRPRLRDAIAEEGVQFVRTRFVADPVSDAALSRLEEEDHEALIVGSIIAAQAFPGRVLGLIAAPGFERVPVDQKRMRSDKFTIF